MSDYVRIIKIIDASMDDEDDEDDFFRHFGWRFGKKKPDREKNRPECIVSPSMMKHAIRLISSLLVLLAAVIIACAILSNKTINVNCAKNVDHFGTPSNWSSMDLVNHGFMSDCRSSVTVHRNLRTWY